MTPNRTLRSVVAAGLVTGITGFAALPVPASAVSLPAPGDGSSLPAPGDGSAAALPPPAAALPPPATRHAAAGQPLAVARTGATALTLSNGTRVAVDAPWTATAGRTAMTGRARSFVATGLGGFFCFYGAAQSGFGPNVAPARPGPPKYTLTIKGFDQAGKPANLDGWVQLYSATSMTWNEYTIGPTPPFRHGLEIRHVPAGKYWVIGMFRSGNSFWMDIPAQVTVTGNTTATVRARAADSEVAAATPRRAVLADAVFSSSYTLRGGQTYEDCGATGGARLWVSPLARAQTTGTLYSATSAQLNSPPAQPAPYTYELDSAAPPGTIASQHLVVTTADLATVHEHFYSDTATTAPWLALGGPARQWGETGFTAATTPLPMPGERTVYFQAQPTAAWRPEISGPLTETPPWQLLQAGQALSTNWNAYPLHPAPSLPPAGLKKPTLVSAVRAANKLIMDVTPFSDNTPGHLGSGVTRFNGVTGSGKWAIYANGVKIAGRTVPSKFPFADVYAAASLGPKPSRIRFTLTTSRQAPGSNLSGTSEDAWTWPSRAEPHAIMRAPWYCGASFNGTRIVYDHRCAVQDMMTLGYQLARESLEGATPAGPQSLGITVNHLPDAIPYRVTHAQVQVSFNNGSTWQPAALARICPGRVCTNQYRATYTAPGGAQVSLRVTARDTHGASVTETILGAYETS